MGPPELDDAPEAVARQRLLACCRSEEWAEQVLAGRPHGSVARTLDAAARACLALSDAGLAEALAAHPRIGDPGAGGERSRREQSAVAAADAGLAAALRDANRAYEQRFGHVFLVRAAGRSPEELLAEARRRLGNDTATERAEVRHQLAEITRLRLAEDLGS